MKSRDLERVPLTRRSIGYFTEDCGATRAGCRGKVRGTLMKCLISQKRESESFLGVFRNAQSRRRQDFDAGKGGGNLGENQGIVRATTGNDQLVNFRFWQHETMQCIDDRERREDCGRADEIVRLGAMAAAESEEFSQVSMAKVLAPCGLGRRQLQVGIPYEVVEQRGTASALRGEMRVFVKTL